MAAKGKKQRTVKKDKRISEKYQRKFSLSLSLSLDVHSFRHSIKATSLLALLRVSLLITSGGT